MREVAVDRLISDPTSLLITIALIGASVSIIIEAIKGLYSWISKHGIKKSVNATRAFNTLAVVLGFVGGVLVEGGTIGAVAGIIAGGTSAWWYHAIVRLAKDGIGRFIGGTSGTAQITAPASDERDPEDM